MTAFEPYTRDKGIEIIYTDIINNKEREKNY